MTDSPTSTETTGPEASSGAPGIPADLTPATADEIPDLRVEIDAIDAEILRLVKRRTEISQRVGLARMNAGGPRIVYNREMVVLAGAAGGGSPAMLLLRLGRGKLGSR